MNRRVFFWLEESRLNTLRDAEAYRLQRQIVLTVDTRRLVDAYSRRILLTHMNTGATRPFAAERGRDTFCRIRGYPFEKRRKVVELAVSREIPDIAKYVQKVEELGGGKPPVTIWTGR